MLKEISTRSMTHAEWIETRRKAIGGSDAAAIVGLNAFATQYEIWASKMGLLPEKPQSEAMRIGHDLEDYVARRFEEAAGKRVRRKNAILYNTDYPFAHANVDRLIVGERAGLECKTTNVLHLKKFRDGEYPPHYYVQCQHYMMVTGLPVWYLAVLILGSDFLWFRIDRNEEDIRALADAERDFWKLVEERREPPADGSRSCTEALNQIYSRAEPESVTDLTPVRRAILLRQEAKQQMDDLRAVVDEQENIIKQYMGSAESGSCDGYSVSWKNTIRKAYSVKETQTRTFRVRELT